VAKWYRRSITWKGSVRSGDSYVEAVPGQADRYPMSVTDGSPSGCVLQYRKIIRIDHDISWY